MAVAEPLAQKSDHMAKQIKPQGQLNHFCGTPGASPGFGRGGPRNYFFRFGNLHVAKLGGFGGMPPRKNFLKWCNLVRFGVYFDHILSLKNFKNYHFLYKKFKNCNFLYKRINILDTRLLWGNYSREEIFGKIYD